VADMEFMQFHPTVLAVDGAPRFLLTEALRGEGARLVNRDGEAFMSRYEAAGDLASRDLVARAMVQESLRTNAPVYLSLTHLDAAFVKERFPTIAQVCEQAGLDLAGAAFQRGFPPQPGVERIGTDGAPRNRRQHRGRHGRERSKGQTPS